MLNERDYIRGNNGYRPPSYWARHSVIFHLIIANAILYLLQNEALASTRGVAASLWRGLKSSSLHSTEPSSL